MKCQLERSISTVRHQKSISGYELDLNVFEESLQNLIERYDKCLNISSMIKELYRKLHKIEKEKKIEKKYV